MINFVNKKKAHLRLGKLGENCACKLLQSKGYKILLRNYRVKYGELDIISQDGSVLVFVEVKTLRKLGKYRPMANYHYKQNRRNIRAAEEYIKQLHFPTCEVRFDFIEVVCDFYHLEEIRHYRNFFLFKLK